MKLRGIIIGLITFFTFTFYAVTQQQLQSRSNVAPPGSRIAPGVKISSGLGLPLDLETWAVLSPDGDSTKVAHLNSEEQKRDRALATLALEHPEGLRNLLKTTPEQKIAFEAATFAILNPREASALAQQGKTPQQLEQEAIAALPIMNPRAYQQSLGNPPTTTPPGQNP